MYYIGEYCFKEDGIYKIESSTPIYLYPPCPVLALNLPLSSLDLDRFHMMDTKYYVDEHNDLIRMKIVDWYKPQNRIEFYNVNNDTVVDNIYIKIQSFTNHHHYKTYHIENCKWFCNYQNKISNGIISIEMTKLNNLGSQIYVYDKYIGAITCGYLNGSTASYVYNFYSIESILNEPEPQRILSICCSTYPCVFDNILISYEILHDFMEATDLISGNKLLFPIDEELSDVAVIYFNYADNILFIYNKSKTYQFDVSSLRRKHKLILPSVII